MEKISENITYEEAIRSQAAATAGVDNTPCAASLENMQDLALRIFEPVRREVCGSKPLAVTSFFRSPEINRRVGGAVTSQHSTGEAMDVDADVYGNGTNRDIFGYIREHLAFDQLIWEFGNDDQPDWIHVSLSRTGNRHQVLRSFKENGKTVYRLM